MARQKKSHFLSRFFLGGFTPEGDEDGFLWVTSKSSGRKWRVRAKEVAHVRDLFRIEKDGVDPDDLEVAFAEVEDLVAPVLRKVVASQKLPEGTDLDVLLHLVALNGARPPGEMTLLQDKFDENLRQQVVNRITPESHERVMRQWQAEGRGTEHVEDLEALKATILGGSVRAVMSRDYFLVAGVLGKASVLVDLLGKRFWTLLIAAAGTEFICSDRPVSLLNIVNVPTNTEPRYTDERFDVIMPLSRSLCLVGHAYGQDGVTTASSRTVGFINHITNAGASDYVYSASEERHVSEEVAFGIQNGNAYRNDVLSGRR